ncbi:MAG TPA: NAD(P)-dependent oxidoreductase [Thermoleophilaceae bacterium]|jgi:nucleoside-diphosphate-sugar epimerase
MKVFVAGATGAVGQRLVPLLVECGFQVTGMTRSSSKQELVHELGAEPVLADGLDRAAVIDAVARAKPDVVIHQMTNLTGLKSFKNFDKDFEITNRLRTEGTEHLIEAARAAGARRFIAQSYGSWIYEPDGTAPRTEADPLDPDPPANQRRSMEAIRKLEALVAGAADIGAIALRYGSFYGPGTGLEHDGDLARLVEKRRFPIIGDGTGVWSFMHIDDAAAITVAAIEHGEPGIYNASDDEPAAVAEWLPALAEALGAKAPRHVPVWLGRLAAGEVGVSMMTRIPGQSNAKARRELSWRPRYPSYREGFAKGLG